MALAPLAVTVEIRALDTGPELVRAFRLSRAVDETFVRLERDLPFEPGRPVVAELSLPGDEQALRLVGIVANVAPDEADEASEGEVSRPRGIAVENIAPDDRRRLAAYITERMQSP